MCVHLKAEVYDTLNKGSVQKNNKSKKRVFVYDTDGEIYIYIFIYIYLVQYYDGFFLDFIDLRSTTIFQLTVVSVRESSLVLFFWKRIAP